MARFMEILRCNGVDQDATPHPAMVVPFGGENQVVLETSGVDLQFQHSALNLQGFDGYELTTDLLRGVRDELSNRDRSSAKGCIHAIHELAARSAICLMRAPRPNC